MPNRVRVLTVPDSDRVKLERRARDRGAPARVAERARIVLLAAEGQNAARRPNGWSFRVTMAWMRGKGGSGGRR